MFGHTLIPLQRFPMVFPVTTSILLIQLVVFVMMLWSGHPADPTTWVQYGAYVDWRFGQGEWWRLITSAFVNTSFLSLILSFFFHYVFAPQLEWLIGRITFLFFYLFTTLIGNYGYVLFEISGIQLGATSAFYGMFGFYIYLYVRRLIDPNSGKGLILLAFINLALSWHTFFAHLLALIAGFLLASLIVEWKRLQAQVEKSKEDDDQSNSQ
ncbi:rhomboid protease GluP [Seinonella peptonophila]|uniref:Rhomboid protease GluP n=1 Tax=Seinonella peptonophila TaxID=112248 RepID=A0A1M4WC39_9BACL|nr:rhomboid family intramembrane serine protease [Seinonella peptonophila]SHE78851.1 rhomboid protease GluP [Seinonella peptonophila]